MDINLIFSFIAGAVAGSTATVFGVSLFRKVVEKAVEAKAEKLEINFSNILRTIISQSTQETAQEVAKV